MSGKHHRGTRPDREIQVIWNSLRSRFDICFGGIPTGAHSACKEVAVDIAIREARLEVNLTGLFIVVTSTLNGRRVLEWDGYGEDFEPAWKAANDQT